MKTALTLVVLLTGFSLQAKIISFNTVDFSNRLTAEEPEFNNDLARVANHVDSWKLAPVNLNAIIVPSGDNASYDYGNNIYIARSMQFVNDWGSDPVYKTTGDVVSVFAHEYGHAVFDDFLGKLLPEHKKLKALKAEISDLDMKRIRGQQNAEQLKALAEQIKQKEKAITENKEFIRLVVLLMPYGELFADTVAVFERDSKGAVFEAIYDPHISKFKNPMGYEYMAGRDFGQLHELEKWTIDESHVLFSPLRSVIGSEACWPTTDEDRALKLKGLARILLADISEKNRDRKTAVIADNKNLMEKYKELCK